MKLKSFIYTLTGLAMATAFSSCDDEKDLIIIDGNLPIKTSTLYMVGDATPNGWSIDAPTPLEASEEDPLIFEWEGNLNPGEMKLCLTPGSWDAPFIRPKNNGDEIGKTAITNAEFTMHAGDPDKKWRVADAGVYHLTFNLRDWTMGTSYLREQDAPEIEPIETETLYLVGDASPLNDWNIDNPTPVEKKSQYEFVYEGKLYAGELKACLTPGDWNASFIRPATDGVKINENGIEDNSFLFSTGPDNKWKVETPGIYRLSFNLKEWTIAVEYIGEFTPASKLYMIGEATAGGWSWDDATEIVADDANDNLFVWEGELARGTFKAAREKDFGAPFYRPASSGVTVSKTGASANDMVYTTDPDDQWQVTEAGNYRLTFDTESMTFEAVYLDGGAQVDPLYMIGTATAGGWSWDAATEVAADAANSNLFVWEGELAIGTFKAAREKDFGAPFYRPASSGVTVSQSGASANKMVFTTDPDDKWEVTDAGNYRLTFDTESMTFEAVFLDGEVQAKPLYMIGSATAGGWSLDDATVLTAVSGKEGVYTWTGTLKQGEFKCSFVKDFEAAFYRPSTENCTVSKSGVSATDMICRAGDPDYKWNVVDEGKYELTLDTKSMTISVNYLN